MRDGCVVDGFGSSGVDSGGDSRTRHRKHKFPRQRFLGTDPRWHRWLHHHATPSGSPPAQRPARSLRRDHSTHKAPAEPLITRVHFRHARDGRNTQEPSAETRCDDAPLPGLGLFRRYLLQLHARLPRGPFSVYSECFLLFMRQTPLPVLLVPDIGGE